MGVKGFSLVEVLVAMALVATSVVGLAELFSIASRVTAISRADTVETIAAATKMAELRALPWTYDTNSGAAVSDAGLAVSGSGTLTSSTGGYVDYVDGAGRLVSAGVAVPPQGVYVRRWSILPLPSDPANSLVLQVVATRVTRPQARDVHFLSILARTAQ